MNKEIAIITNNVYDNVNTEDGFFCFEFVHNEEKYYLQCCLESSKRGGFKKAISRATSGYDEGLCKDANEHCFNKFGKDFCFSLLLKIARKMNVKISN